MDFEPCGSDLNGFQGVGFRALLRLAVLISLSIGQFVQNMNPRFLWILGVYGSLNPTPETLNPGFQGFGLRVGRFSRGWWSEHGDDNTPEVVFQKRLRTQNYTKSQRQILVAGCV